MSRTSRTHHGLRPALPRLLQLAVQPQHSRADQLRHASEAEAQPRIIPRPAAAAAAAAAAVENAVQHGGRRAPFRHACRGLQRLVALRTPLHPGPPVPLRRLAFTAVPSLAVPSLARQTRRGGGRRRRVTRRCPRLADGGPAARPAEQLVGEVDAVARRAKHDRLGVPPPALRRPSALALAAARA